ncbi:hypothetical protein EW145_g6922 [Phellinidium pouzarii]|uniref:Ubiquitin 3 binding protein But2 C-terminal domain-containing protein n=1 Tax=Phellinidium pouzarii TaxID=167371 RepID=A0A4S4KSV4_9AGAM|nr:hypothetical protein EW145_g6922 [Phellinidium pouzarii]
MKNSTKYSPLPIDEDESTASNSLSDSAPTDDGEILDGAEKAAWTTSSHVESHSAAARRLLIAAVILTLVCSVTSLVFLFLNARVQWQLHDLLGAAVVHSDRHLERPDPGLLERPNVYIGLDKVAQDVSQAALPDTLDVFPPFFQPVDHIHRNYVFPDDGHARFTFNGRVAPGDHRVLLTDHITMVAQFRVHDFGMERCRIVSTIPSWEVLEAYNQTLHLAGDTSNIEIWNVTASAELDERTLSWATKPARDEHIGSVGLEENSTRQSGEFWCGPSGSLQTIELLCRGVSCFIELWQDYYFKPRFGIYIQQSPSLK